MNGLLHKVTPYFFGACLARCGNTLPGAADTQQTDKRRGAPGRFFSCAFLYFHNAHSQTRARGYSLFPQFSLRAACLHFFFCFRRGPRQDAGLIADGAALL